MSGSAARGSGPGPGRRWRRNLVLKRLFDAAASSAGLLLVSPVLLGIAILVRLDSPGPAVFRSTRIGRGGRPFTVLKFRTMVAGAPSLGPSVTYRGDLRVTRVGAWLRASKLDELPQLINVLKGEMSLVGPRAEDTRHLEVLRRDFPEILLVPPGMASLSWLLLTEFHEEKLEPGGNAEEYYLRVCMPRKLNVEVEYVRNFSLGLDLAVLVKTITGIGRTASLARGIHLPEGDHGR